MLRARVIPLLLLRHESLVKTRRFGHPEYIGDPCNTVRIFNELEVDELIFLDISATLDGSGPRFGLLEDIASECFMPLAYGGGISNFQSAERVFRTGFEKVVLNSALATHPDLVGAISRVYGSQAVVASIDVRQHGSGRHEVYTHAGTKNQKVDPVRWAKRAEQLGAGEIVITSIDREGSWSGFDLDLVREVSQAVSVPVVAHGGAGNFQDIDLALSGGASAVALGSMVVFQRKGMGVLVSMPDRVKEMT